ncbi:MAG: enoyl-CoA hydratase/isomerase family protein [Gaiellaceae bacterium MAG52_C11]|nr:enoyl-CoA hydratase/isomerase family protein [Candidatus Gaiellasilicea maunaloa]
MEYDRISLDVADGVATLTFTLPEVANALDIDALQEVMDALYRIEKRDDVGALVLTGAGDKAFCAGINLKEVPIDEGDAEIDHHFRYKAMWWHQVMHKLTRIRLPVLSAVNGIAAGGGFGIVLASDMAVCVDSARFLCSWHANGVANDGATSYTLAKIVGFRRAMEMMLTNQTLGADEAREWGIVNRVYPQAEFRGHVATIAADLAAGPTHLQAMAKERFHMGWRQSIEECTEFEIQNIMDSLAHPYFKASLRRFVNKEGRNDQVKVRLP